MNNDRSDEKFIDAMKQEFVEYNEPPAPPRDAMWARIQQQRAAERTPDAIIHVPRSWWTLRRWIPAVVAAAVVLAVGIGIGRLSQPGNRVTTVAEQKNTQTDEQTSDRPMAARPEPTATTRDDEARRQQVYRLAAVPLMNKAELLLTQFRSSDPTTKDNTDFTGRAASLLLDTRLLLGTPASEDAELKQLLGDLELVLARIVRLAEERQSERELIDDSIETRSLLPRLRAGATI